MRFRIAIFSLLSLSLFDGIGGSGKKDVAKPRFQVPPGFIVEKVAGPPLVRYPLFAAFDDHGRLFVAEGTGTNLPGSELLKLKKQLGRILVLEDTAGDGKFDKSTVYADDLVFPTGVLWHDGALYATSHPNLWKFEEKEDKVHRQMLVSKFNFNGNGCDIHGPFLGPDGRLYWTDGRHGYKVKTKEGMTLEGFASRIWRCRIDGSGIERICGGGFDNPVELAFTPEGDMLGTMDQGPGDALLHYVEGGVYPMEHPCIKEFPMTGPMLGSVKQYTAALPVALCGLTRYRSTQFGPDYQNSLFTAQFNVHRIEQHILVRDGATFRSKDKDFLTSTDHDTHFTDVLEDADGSLLVVDMGAWFNYGCPTSKIAKPEVLGGIYRIRRTDAPPVVDPWGKTLKLAQRSAAELSKLLDDPRPKVRDQVITQMSRKGDAVGVLATVFEGGRSVQARRNAVWALCRIHTPEALIVLRNALTDKDSSVRQAAVHALGLEKDERALERLMAMTIKEELSIRLKAAEALGRIGHPRAIPALLEAVHQGASDRFLEHAFIYALIRINDPKETLPALDHANPRVRQAGLIALDQMQAGKLTREQVVPLLDTDDPELQQAVLAVMSRRPGWSKDTLGLLGDWMRNPKLSPDRERSLKGALVAFSSEKNVQSLVATALADPKTSPSMRLLLLGAISRCRMEPLPQRWLDVLGRELDRDDLAVRRETVATIKARNLSQFDKQLVMLSQSKNLPADLRIAAFDCVAQRQKKVDSQIFTLLIDHLAEKTDPLLRVSVARALGATSLDNRQVVQLAESLTKAGPMTVPFLVPAFSKCANAEVGRALVSSLQKSPGAESLSAADLDQCLKGFPEEIRALAKPLYDRLLIRHKEQAVFLVKISSSLKELSGNSERGKQVFFSRKVGCASCHRAAGGGGNVGPDLSQVGRFRSQGDLLESIVYPSSSIVPEFRTYIVNTRAGTQVTGMIVRESSEAIYLRTPQLAEIRLARDNVELMRPSPISLMPDGLEKTMTPQELRDLLEFLLQQK
jgi:putative heme-binding domain-containing protein